MTRSNTRAFVRHHSLAVGSSMVAAGLVALGVYIYNAHISPERAPSGTILRPGRGDQVAATTDVIVSIHDLWPDDQVWLLVEQSGCVVPYGTPYAATSGADVDEHRFDDVAIGDPDDEAGTWYLEIVTVEPGAAQAFGLFQQEPESESGLCTPIDGLTSLHRIEVTRERAPTATTPAPVGPETDEEPVDASASDDTAPRPVGGASVAVQGPDGIAGEASQAGTFVVVAVTGPAGAERAHGFLDVDGDPTTGMAVRNGADLLLEEERLYPWGGTEWCAADDDEMSWCWNLDDALASTTA